MLKILNIYNLICQKNEESRFLLQSLHKKTQPGQNFYFTLSKELSHTHAGWTSDLQNCELVKLQHL